MYSSGWDYSRRREYAAIEVSFYYPPPMPSSLNYDISQYGTSRIFPYIDDDGDDVDLSHLSSHFRCHPDLVCGFEGAIFAKIKGSTYPSAKGKKADRRRFRHNIRAHLRFTVKLLSKLKQ